MRNENVTNNCEEVIDSNSIMGTTLKHYYTK